MVATLTIIALAGCGERQPQAAGISQVVEIRDGRKSVWGIDVRLGRLSFQDEVRRDQIKVIDGKHGRDVADIMAWHVSADRKLLRIMFKPGCGDFGSGNGATVHVDATAIKGDTGGNNRLEWSIGTDLK